MEIIRQDRKANEQTVANSLEIFDKKIMSMIETIREDIFEIFNLIQGGGTRENPQQDKIVCLDYEVDRLKS